jgi:hypothetical protein
VGDGLDGMSSWAGTGSAIGSAWIGVRRVAALSEAGYCRRAGRARHGGAMRPPVRLAVAEARDHASEACGLSGLRARRAWVTYGCTYVRRYVAMAVRHAGLAVWRYGMSGRRPACPPDRVSPPRAGTRCGLRRTSRPWSRRARRRGGGVGLGPVIRRRPGHGGGELMIGDRWGWAWPAATAAGGREVQRVFEWRRRPSARCADAVTVGLTGLRRTTGRLAPRGLQQRADVGHHVPHPRRLVAVARAHLGP